MPQNFCPRCLNPNEKKNLKVHLKILIQHSDRNLCIFVHRVEVSKFFRCVGCWWSTMLSTLRTMKKTNQVKIIKIFNFSAGGKKFSMKINNFLSFNYSSWGVSVICVHSLYFISRSGILICNIKTPEFIDTKTIILFFCKQENITQSFFLLHLFIIQIS